ncbi:MAG: hypothetical protein AMXMBFR47_07050 [Planctomycetota bacterium]
MRTFVLGLVIGLLPASFTWAQCAADRLGHWGGAAGAAAASDLRLYAAIGPDLIVFDTFNPSQPVELGRVAIGTPYAGLATEGNLLVCWGAQTGLLTIDVSDSTSPRIVGRLDGIAPNWVALHGDLAYVGVEAGLEVFDLTDPAAPVAVGQVSTDYPPAKIVINAGYAYVRIRTPEFYSGRLLIFDLSDPIAPELVNQLPQDDIQAFDARDDVLIAASRGTTFRRYAIHLGGQPELVAELPFYDSWVDDVQLTGGGVMYAASGSAIHAFTLAESAELHYTNGYATPGYGSLRTTIRNFAVAGGSTGLRVVDERARNIGGFRYAGVPEAIVVRDSIAYLACGAAGLQIVDVAEPAAPTLIATIRPHNDYSGIRAVAAVGDRAYTGDSHGEVLAWNVGDPAHPVALGEVGPLQGTPTRIVADEQRLYVVTRRSYPLESTLYAFDNRGAMPTLAASIDFPAERAIWDISLKDGRLAVGQEGGMTVFDATDPAQLAEVLFVRVLNSAIRTVALADASTLFAIDNSGHGRAYDIRDVQRPRYQGHFYTGMRDRISISGNRLYAGGTSYPTTLWFDIRDPYQITQIGQIPTRGEAVFAVPDSDITYLGGWVDGLTIHRVSHPADVNRDGEVGIADLALLLAHFGEFTAEGIDGGDLDCDGQVGIEDLSLIVSLFGR